MEALRAVHLAFERGAKLFDACHQEMEKAEGLYHSLNQSIKETELKLRQLVPLATVEREISEEIQTSLSTSEMIKEVFVNNGEGSKISYFYLKNGNFQPNKCNFVEKRGFSTQKKQFFVEKRDLQPKKVTFSTLKIHHFSTLNKN